MHNERLAFHLICVKICSCFVFVSVLMKDRCKLFCRVAGSTAYYQLRDRVVDGTPCGPDTNDICVQGLCRVSSIILIDSDHHFCQGLSPCGVNFHILTVNSFNILLNQTVSSNDQHYFSQSFINLLLKRSCGFSCVPSQPHTEF